MCSSSSFEKCFDLREGSKKAFTKVNNILTWIGTRMNQQSQFNRVNGFGGHTNGLLQMNSNKLQKGTGRSQVTRQTQPLSVSQLHNIQQHQQQQQFQGQEGSFGQGRSVKVQPITTEAQFARAKISSKKLFDFEDDLEFYPNPIETTRIRSQPQQAGQQSAINSRMVMNGSPISPYNTPTKPVQFNQQQVHRMGYMSPAQVIGSPQQQQPQRVINHNQIFNSPQNMSNARRLDLSNISPMYQNSSSTTRHW